VDKGIKEDNGKEKKEEIAAEKLAAKKKAEEERISQLSAAEQKKRSSNANESARLGNNRAKLLGSEVYWRDTLFVHWTTSDECV